MDAITTFELLLKALSKIHPSRYTFTNCKHVITFCPRHTCNKQNSKNREKSVFLSWLLIWVIELRVSLRTTLEYSFK